MPSKNSRPDTDRLDRAVAEARRNWELLCMYCHDNEHSRYLDAAGRGETTPGGEHESRATYRPFADL